MSGALLLTGGTGFLGMELIARLLEEDSGPEIFLAVRAHGEDPGVRRDELLGHLYDRAPAAAERLHPIPAELTADGLGLAAADLNLLKAEVSHLIHCAASISFTLPLDLARSINVAGTERVLELARELPSLERMVHVSTAYVAGRLPGLFSEDDDGGGNFRNTYECTKLEAEVAVAAAEDVPTVIVRPSIVVGEADSGWTSAFNVLYWPLQAFARGFLTEVPADRDGIVDMVPVDYVARIIERAAFAPGISGRFHAVAGDRAVTVGELMDAVCRELDLPPPVVMRPGTRRPDDSPAAVFVPYFDVDTRFDNRRALMLAGEDGRPPEPRSYLRQLIEFGLATRWGKRPMTREAARSAAGLAASPIRG